MLFILSRGLSQMLLLYLALVYNTFTSHQYTTTTAFVPIPNNQLSRIQSTNVVPSNERPLASRSFTSLCQQNPVATSSIGKEELSKHTIKELKEYIDNHISSIPKGMSSKLKRKADIIDFILSQSSHSKMESTSSDDDKSIPSAQQKKLRANPQRMAPLPKPPMQHPKPKVVSTQMGSSDVETSSPEEEYTPTAKDIIIEQVLERYPPLRTQIKLADKLEGQNIPFLRARLDGVGENDIRHTYHPMMRNAPTSSDIDVVFIGTASCTPGFTRGVSCTALRLQWRRDNSREDNKNHGAKNIPSTPGTWIFDVGECTQLQIQKTGSIKPGKITKIFITHAHGDHSFGLPGLLCLMGQDRDRDGPPVEIYGPEGLRMWLRVAIRYSVSRIVPPYRVHEIMDIPMAPEWDLGKWKNGRYFYQLHKEGGKGEPWGRKGLAGEDLESWISQSPMLHLEPFSQFGEVEGGRDIYPNYNHPKCVDGAPIWEVEDDGDVTVHAAPMSHGVPCIGYVVEEESKPGRLRNDLVAPIAQKNFAALKESGMRHPMKILATIKALPEDGSYTFPDGTVVQQRDVVEKTREGRKIVICGDTADSRAIAGLAQGADILVHEATNTYLRGIDKDTTYSAVTRDAKIHGHTTPQMAGIFAKKVGARRLLLNHFSARYKGDQSPESMSLMLRIERQAIEASGISEENLAATWDFMVLPVPQK